MPFKPPKIAVYLWPRCQSYNLVTSFTQQKLILADLREKKILLRECVRKKFFETILSNSHKWKMVKNKEGRKQPGPWLKPCHQRLSPQLMLLLVPPSPAKKKWGDSHFWVTEAGISHWLYPYCGTTFQYGSWEISIWHFLPLQWEVGTVSHWDS